MEKIEKVAVLHVHTTHSDGTGTPAEVIRTAQNSDIDILGINDHNNLRLRNEGLGGWQGNLFVLAGAELQDENDRNHLLVYGLDVLPDTSDTEKQIEFVNNHSGIAIVAHPFEKPGKLPHTKSYCWTRGVLDGLSGVEVWNYMSEWKADISVFNFISKYRHPDKYVVTPEKNAMGFWQQVGGCVIGGVDAHNFKAGGLLNLSMFPYEYLMGKTRTHILLDSELPSDSKEAEKIIVDALRCGNCFVSNGANGDARGFRCECHTGKIRMVLPESGKVEIASMDTVLFSDHLDGGEHLLDVCVEEKCAVTISRDERMWIFCGLH